MRRTFTAAVKPRKRGRPESLQPAPVPRRLKPPPRACAWRSWPQPPRWHRLVVGPQGAMGCSRRIGSVRTGYADLGCRPQATLRFLRATCDVLSTNRIKKVQGACRHTRILLCDGVCDWCRQSVTPSQVVFCAPHMRRNQSCCLWRTVDGISHAIDRSHLGQPVTGEVDDSRVSSVWPPIASTGLHSETHRRTRNSAAARIGGALWSAGVG